NSYRSELTRELDSPRHTPAPPTLRLPQRDSRWAISSTGKRHHSCSVFETSTAIASTSASPADCVSEPRERIAARRATPRANDRAMPPPHGVDFTGFNIVRLAGSSEWVRCMAPMKWGSEVGRAGLEPATNGL